MPLSAAVAFALSAGCLASSNDFVRDNNGWPLSTWQVRERLNCGQVRFYREHRILSPVSCRTGVYWPASFDEPVPPTTPPPPVPPPGRPPTVSLPQPGNDRVGG